MNRATHRGVFMSKFPYKACYDEEDFTCWIEKNQDYFLSKDAFNEKVESLKRILDNVVTFYGRDIFEDFSELEDELSRKIDLFSFKTELISFLLYIGETGQGELFKKDNILRIAHLVAKHEHLLNLLSIAKNAVAKQNRAKQDRTNPNKQKAIEEAIRIWGNSPSYSLDEVAERIRNARITHKSHSTVKQWISKYNPTRRKKK